MKRIIMVIATTMLCRALFSDTNELSHVRAELEAHCASRNWNYRVLTGDAYTNYLEEVEAGLWQ